MAEQQGVTAGGQRLVVRDNLAPFILVTALFFLWGIPNNLNDVLIRQFMKSFEITRFKAGLVQSSFYMGYFLLSMPAALIMRRYGYKAGLVTGLFLYGAGTLLFWPAAIVGRYSFFLFALFMIASGRTSSWSTRWGFRVTPSALKVPTTTSVGTPCGIPKGK